MSGFAQGSRLARRQVASPNFGRRLADIDMIVLHYTGCSSAEAALLWMCSPDSQVSAHYLVDEDGEIVQLVDEGARAWHAGVAHWAGVDDINSCSIGIEIDNFGHELNPLPPYPDKQIQALEELCGDIMARHGIAAHRVIGHSDVAPARKSDPGEHFPWERLARAGIGAWVEAAGGEEGKAGKVVARPGDEGEVVRRVQDDLRRLGYGLEASGVFDERTEAVVRAFQRHWRRGMVDGVADEGTLTVLSALLDSLVKVA